MSDDIVKRLRVSAAWEDVHDAADLIEAQAAEITCLRAELDTARLVPPLNPDRWRGAINDALTNWMDSILDDETPKDALRRLIQYEITAALDPAVSQSAADLVATARREGMEEAAKIAWDYAIRLDDMAELSRYPHVKREHEGRSWVAQSIAAAIRAAAKEGKP